ncbi:MAG: bifunctional diaminohydroxyphosphoribosylaminopyrimidine deaminase/5-amino-6-(5-phosphoribosylamino)uracil reductase RibD [Thermonemataceae bacterium]
MIQELYMQRALELAALGRGKVAPNPMVGCVIVYQDQVVGEGWHMQYGEAHAEVNAIRSVQDERLLPECTVYVTLEPCAHFGKTPPCADLLVEKGVKKVVIGAVDSNPLVGGKGIAKLKAAGIEVLTGVLEEEVRQLNKRFFTFIEQKRPYIILKWAETADGFIARENFDAKWISNIYARQLVHQWRSEEAGIMVGRQTALYDDPQLNVRLWEGKNPTRIVIDRYQKLPTTLQLFDQQQPTICYTTLVSSTQKNLQFVQLPENDFLPKMLQDLHKQGIQSVIVEGGSILLQQFIKHNYWDEARIFKSPQCFHQGIVAPALSRAQLVATENVLGDALFWYVPIEVI